MDPEYVRFKAVGQVWGELGRNLADSLIVPLDANEYAASLKKFIADMLAKYGEKLMQHDINIGMQHKLLLFQVTDTPKGSTLVIV